jgi:hypothetical protein
LRDQAELLHTATNSKNLLTSNLVNQTNLINRIIEGSVGKKEGHDALDRYKRSEKELRARDKELDTQVKKGDETLVEYRAQYRKANEEYSRLAIGYYGISVLGICMFFGGITIGWPWLFNGIDANYYSASCQIIAVVFIAVYLENKRTAKSDATENAPWRRAGTTIGGLIWLVIGEVTALYVLATGVSNLLTLALNVLSLGFLFYKAISSLVYSDKS